MARKPSLAVRLKAAKAKPKAAAKAKPKAAPATAWKAKPKAAAKPATPRRVVHVPPRPAPAAAPVAAPVKRPSFIQRLFAWLLGE